MDDINNDNMNNDDMNNNVTSLADISNDSIFVSEADSIQTETTQSSYSERRPQEDIWTEFDAIFYRRGKHKEARFKVLQDIQNEDVSIQSGTSTSKKKRKSGYSMLTIDAYYDTKEAIDKTKERTTLATTILDVEAANIILKIEKELLKSKNLILCIDSWCSPLKRSIYAFMIMTDEKKQYIYSLRDFSMSSHTANFNAEKIIEVIENVGSEKFVAVVSDAESAMTAAKHLIATKYLYILPVRFIKFFRNSYISGAALNQEIISTFTIGRNLKMKQDPQVFNRANTVKELISNRQFWIDVEQLQDILCPNHILKKALQIWKKLGGGRTSADLLKTQMNLYKNHKPLFEDKFIASANTITNWWMSIEMTRYEDHIKCLALKLHSISLHNAV
ncbi:32807_t:CDS:2, partial [Racocetra persica]